MTKIIETSLAPSPIGPYSQAVQAGNFLFLSGQIAMDAKTGDLIVADIKQETALVLKNIAYVLEKAGYTFANIVKTSIFLSDMKHFTIVNELYGACFNGNFPARETIAVLGLPKNANVEISITAYKETG